MIFLCSAHIAISLAPVSVRVSVDGESARAGNHNCCLGNFSFCA